MLKRSICPLYASLIHLNSYSTSQYVPDLLEIYRNVFFCFGRETVICGWNHNSIFDKIASTATRYQKAHQTSQITILDRPLNDALIEYYYYFCFINIKKYSALFTHLYNIYWSLIWIGFVYMPPGRLRRKKNGKAKRKQSTLSSCKSSGLELYNILVILLHSYHGHC